MEHQKLCPSCGTPLEKNALFCIQCGAAVQVPDPSATAAQLEDFAEKNEGSEKYRKELLARESVQVPHEEDDMNRQTAQSMGLRMSEDGNTDGLSNPFLSPKGGGLRSILHPNVKPFAPSPNRRVRFRENKTAQPESEELAVKPATEKTESVAVQLATPLAELPTVEALEAPIEVSDIEGAALRKTVPVKEPELPIEVVAAEAPEPMENVIPIVEETRIPAETTMATPKLEDISEWMQGPSGAELENKAETEQRKLADHIRQQVEAMYPEPDPDTMPDEPADNGIPSKLKMHNRIITAPIMGGFGSPTAKELSKAKTTRFGKPNSDINDNARRK